LARGGFGKALKSGMAFDSHSVLALESRRAAEMEKLITHQGGRAFVAPSMREVPIESNVEAFAFAEKLFAGQFDLVILLTGVGTRYLDKVIATRYEPGKFAEALRKLPVIVRGPKPLAVCREMNIPVAGIAAEPNTWHELMTVIEARAEKCIAVQEYGKTNPELMSALEARGAEVTAVPVYQWAMPEDTGPLREAVRRLAAKEFDAVLFTTSIQTDHLMQIAEQEQLVGPLREGLDNAVIASIGPTTTEALNGHGLQPDFEPTHPKMGIMVFELARDFHELREKKSRSRL
jgi:uroporphyrinogen-III synthase